MAITFTPSAAERIKQSVAQFGGQGLRLGVKKVGCNGFAYTYDVAKDIAPTDHVFEAHDTKVVVPADSLAFLDGSELDFVRDNFKQMFAVANPNVKSTCGCGESFNVE
jgi:iron-sulfur cluster assembly protein